MTRFHARDAAGPELAGPLADRIHELEGDPDFVAEALALHVMEEASRIMAKQDISRSDLATRMGVTRARVTQLFNAPPNLTLRSIAQLAIALGSTPHASLFPTCPSAAKGLGTSSILPAGATDAHSLAPNATDGHGGSRLTPTREEPNGGPGLGGSRQGPPGGDAD